MCPRERGRTEAWPQGEQRGMCGTVPQVGQILHWRSVDSCPAQPRDAYF